MARLTELLVLLLIIVTIATCMPNTLNVEQWLPSLVVVDDEGKKYDASLYDEIDREEECDENGEMVWSLYGEYAPLIIVVVKNDKTQLRCP